MMPAITSLARLSSILTEEHDEPVIHTPATLGNLESVTVLADVWEGGQVIALTFTSLTELLAAQDYQPEEPSVVEVLQGSALLPFSVPAETMNSFMQAVFMVNRLLPLCSYGVDVEQGACYLQCSLLVSPPDLPAEIAMDTVGHAAAAIQQYGRDLLAVAAGTISLEGFRAELAARGMLPPPIPVADQEMQFAG